MGLREGEIDRTWRIDKIGIKMGREDRQDVVVRRTGSRNELVTGTGFC